MKKWQVATLVGVVLIAIILVSVKASGPRGDKVYVETVKRRNIESVVSAPGEIDPKVKVNISAHVIGKIERIYFKEGDTVRRGMRLVDLEKTAFVAQRDRALAELANRRIEVKRSRINLANAELSLKRAQSLREQGVQAEELFDRTRLEWENAKSTLASSDQGVRQSAAMLAQASDDLSRTTILSPIDGRVVSLSAHEGEVVITGTMNNPGSVIAIIADLSEILVQADVAETEIVKVRIGHPARVKVDAVPDKEYHGQVVEIGSSATPRANTGSGIRYFTVKVAIQDADDRLRPGMTSQIEIISDAVKNVMSVPVQSVVDRSPEDEKKGKKDKKDEETAADENIPKQKYVFVEKNAKAELVPVRTGISNATHVQITSGLKGDEKVVTGPFRTLKKLKNHAAIQPGKEPTGEKKSDETKDDQ